MGYFDKNYHPPGTSPGTLIEHQLVEPSQLTIRIIDYTATDFIDKELATPDECRPYLENDSITWIHLQGLMPADTIRNIGDIFMLHPLAMEDILNKGQRPKIEEYDEQLFMIMTLPTSNDDSTTMEQVSIFLGENYIISFHAGDSDPFGPLYKRLQKKSGRIRNQQADYLLYCILDLIVDQGYPLLESFGEKIETIEEALLRTSVKQSTLAEIHHLRRELLLLRRHLWPQREVLTHLLRGENPLIREGTFLYLRDCYDHTIQIMDLIENYREMAASMIDVYLSSTSNRLNEIMRVLTMIATLFIPLTFVVGLYGMNFSHPKSPWAMPELHWYYGYPMILGVMIAMVIGMIIYFKRKHWL